MKASIVIPSYNQSSQLLECLISFNHQIIEEDDIFDVVVVDDGSTDGTRGMLESIQVPYELKYIFLERNENSSRSATRNRGVNESDGEVVIFLDGDQVVNKSFVSSHLRLHKKIQNCVGVGFRRNLMPGVIDIDKLREGLIESALPPYIIEERENIIQKFSYNAMNYETIWHICFSCNLSVQRKQLQRVGLFSEDFYGWGLEDCEFAYRFYKDNAFFVFCREATVYHQYHEAHFDEERYQKWLENLAMFEKLHPEIDVVLQEILKSTFNPEIMEEWEEVYTRFEYAVRASKGRNINCAPIELIIIKDGERECLIKEINSRRVQGTDVAIINLSRRENIDLAILTINTESELLYFHRPEKDELIQIYGNLLKRGIVKQSFL